MAKSITQLPIPDFFAPDHAKSIDYQPARYELQEIAANWRKTHALKPVGSDKLKVHLLVIDAQKDFGFPDGALFVGGRSGTGAMDDHMRLCQFIYKHLGLITQMTCTMDTHLPYQIFYSIAHIDDKGNHPAPNTQITADEYRKGRYRPNPEMAALLNISPVWLQKQFTYYCEQLEKTGKYALTIWNYHTMLGSPGHALVGIIEEARLFHCFARGAENTPEIKGGNPLTEHYSIFKPEVTTCWDGKPIPNAQKNARLIETLLNSDVVIITGEAKSHCLAWSIDDFLTEIVAKDKELAKKVYLMEDCTSAVVIPGVIDYTDEADKAFKKFSDAGMNVVSSTTPIEKWPGMDKKLAVL
jgi:nicotinamidase-related amidase